ncbi:putative potassium transport 1 protein [Rutstroemia sp. NJR-2017a WRK4]|nr:putative potassium transport 1 protein [Rutstroemia sp. NJR-2017a WRK4]
MFSLLIDLWHQIAALKPSFISKSPHFNFITVHYFWIIGMALLGSVCVYIQGGIPYIDALFFASGGATQSGLNTIDLNKLNTWQQTVLYLLPIFTNPITINSFVVFLRLYWFEKRFQHIAAETKKNRRSFAKSFSKSKTLDRDNADAERGVNGRSIVVMHEGSQPNGIFKNGDVFGGAQQNAEKEKAMNEAERMRGSDGYGSGSSNMSSTDTATDNSPASHQTQIKFADQVKFSNGMADEALRLPARRSEADHIAFLERQRNPEDKAVLRIPGPRDADAGVAPQTVEEESEPVHRSMSRRASTFDPRRGSQDAGTLNEDVPPEHQVSRKRNITIEVPPTHPKVEHVVEDARAAGQAVSSVLKFRTNRTKTDGGEDGDVMTKLKSRAPTFQTIKTALTGEKEDPMPYFSWAPTVGRNSAFVDLTEQQREELGGIEYRSLKSLALILSCYFWGFSIFAVVCLLPWILHNKTYGSIVEQDGQGRVWWGIFTANSAFTDLGFTLTPDSMISFNTAIWPLLVMSFLIIIGNTGFPIMLRLIIWVTSLWVPTGSGIWEELRFLLDHPRRCFTLLFPSKATWWLFWILIILNGLDLLFFIILDLGNTIVTQLPVNIRVLDGWFQAASTRTAGFGVVNLAELHPAIQVSYLIMIAYGTVGLSLGYTNINASFSAEFNTISKLVIIAMQIRGRHRGLPYELDRAILLPSEHLQEKEAQDAAHRAHRRNSTATAVGSTITSAPVSTGAAKLPSRGKSSDHQAPPPNFLSSLLHPGPTIPNSHRDFSYSKSSHARRHSIATPQGGRSVSPKARPGVFSKWSTAEKPQEHNPHTEV